ncbi:hypothetical protein BT63DRAFT_411326 [Microthyrium microscopicum]|uniref:NADH dehydrogenase [ubiquinone] 1 beta subcomplex subunit 11, mitochondrial n=1 Tax=Microthyrium microscopicum TaxID=703497 RepID=A0A6A6UKN1_9PEZI|nr:hypothetical protein BT63DRAFT_411326 [Microthyrium microscopicum]
MPLVRPSAGLLRPSKALTSSVARTSRTKPFSTTTRQQAGHAPHYDPPGGWLFGVQPGTKPKREGWELPFYYGFVGSFALTIVAYVFKPDTSIQTWALEEARRRLEAEGFYESIEEKK